MELYPRGWLGRHGHLFKSLSVRFSGQSYDGQCGLVAAANDDDDDDNQGPPRHAGNLPHDLSPPGLDGLFSGLGSVSVTSVSSECGNICVVRILYGDDLIIVHTNHRLELVWVRCRHVRVGSGRTTARIQVWQGYCYDCKHGVFFDRMVVVWPSMVHGHSMFLTGWCSYALLSYHTISYQPSN